MIRVAIIAYGRSPDFEVTTPETPPLEERIAWGLLSKPVFRRACENEGVDLKPLLKICGLTREEFEAMKQQQDRESSSEIKDGKRQSSSDMTRRKWLRVWRAKL